MIFNTNINNTFTTTIKVNQSINQSIKKAINQSINQSINQNLVNQINCAAEIHWPIYSYPPQITSRFRIAGVSISEPSKGGFR